MKRVIKFSQFRNIGTDEEQTLVLNSCFKKGRMGNLVILIGANNSGKSNVLDGIFDISSDGQVSEKDENDYSFEDKDRHPTISLAYLDHEGHGYEYRKGLNEEEGKWSVSDGFELKTDAPSLTTIKKNIADIVSKINETRNRYGYSGNYNSIENLNQKIQSNQVTDQDLLKLSLDAVMSIRGTNAYNILSQEKTNQLIQYCEALNTNNETSKILYSMNKAFGVNPLPHVYRYQEKVIANNDLTVQSPDNIRQSLFFSSLFARLNIDVAEIRTHIRCIKNFQILLFWKSSAKSSRVKLIRSVMNSIGCISNQMISIISASDSTPTRFPSAWPEETMETPSFLNTNPPGSVGSLTCILGSLVPTISCQVTLS